MFSVVGQNISSFFSSILKKNIQNEIHNSILVSSENDNVPNKRLLNHYININPEINACNA